MKIYQFTGGNNLSSMSLSCENPYELADWFIGIEYFTAQSTAPAYVMTDIIQTIHTSSGIKYFPQFKVVDSLTATPRFQTFTDGLKFNFRNLCSVHLDGADTVEKIQLYRSLVTFNFTMNNIPSIRQFTVGFVKVA